MAVVEVPGSKSITARALFLAAAARGTTVLRKPLDSDDTAGFAEGLIALGYQLDRTPGRWQVEGRPQGPAVAQPAEHRRPHVPHRAFRQQAAEEQVAGLR